jgi:predicted TPR repeat methyltransferase
MALTPDTVKRVMTPDEAIATALLMQKEGELDAAEILYRKVLDDNPNHLDAIHYLGLLAYQYGDSDAAGRMLERVIAADPEHADAHSNLGMIRKAQGRLEDATAEYRRAIALNPRHANAYTNLGVLLRAQGQIDEAEAAYRRAIELNAGHAEAYHNLGVLLAGSRRIPDAVFCFCKATTLAPESTESRRMLAHAYAEIGDRVNAIRVAHDWLALQPDDPIAVHTLASVSGTDPPPRAADAYIERAFDEFASTFDAKLTNLAYRAPQLVAAVLSDARGTPSSICDVLDAGCGTGLCGPVIAPYARSLVGVDLSAKMLAAAAERKVYTELVKGELTEYLETHPGSYDIVVSADTLCYFGDLTQVIGAAAAALRPGGTLVFTVEHRDDTGDGAGYGLQFNGRYHHTKIYVTHVLERAGLTAELIPAELRLEGGRPVAGLVAYASKPVTHRTDAAVSRGD